LGYELGFNSNVAPIAVQGGIFLKKVQQIRRANVQPGRQTFTHALPGRAVLSRRFAKCG
jgi:hypothetical protein